MSVPTSIGLPVHPTTSHPTASAVRGASPNYSEHAAAADLLRSLASPARVAIVMSLRERSMCVHELVDELALNQPQVSQHLSVLKKSGVVVGTRRGREIEYALADDHVSHIVVDAIVHATELHEADR